MYLLPQEIEVWYIIPAIRKELAKLLTQKYELSYDKAGVILGVSKAAISQYLSNKRANKIKSRNKERSRKVCWNYFKVSAISANRNSKNIKDYENK